ncbi:MAG: hypothetical protein IKY52_03575 [Clostridia bacterium]|nr:hypothetical protein [Clostridia bacterium]
MNCSNHSSRKNQNPLPLVIPREQIPAAVIQNHIPFADAALFARRSRTL